MINKLFNKNRPMQVCLILAGAFWLLLPAISWAEMSTSNFTITNDVIGSFGNSSSSANYELGDTGGEVGTGYGSATNYDLGAGFWQSDGFDQPFLTFTINNNSVDLGTLTSSATGSGTATFEVTTNAANGYVVEYFGTTLANGGETIDAMSSVATASPGTEQFGFNLRANTTPSGGADPSGGSGLVSSDYNTVDSYKFSSGDTIAYCSTESDTTTFTMSFIGNIAGNTAEGNYVTNLTLLATGKF
jgi:hypothetical protein